MAVIQARGSAVDATYHSAEGSGGWADATNCIDGTYGTDDATYGRWTTTAALATGYIEVGGFDFSSIPSGATINSTTVKLRHYETNTTRVAAVTFQPVVDGSGVGSAYDCTRATSARSDSTTFTMTLEQLQDASMCVRVNGTRYDGASSSSLYIDYVDIEVEYTAGGTAASASGSLTIGGSASAGVRASAAGSLTLAGSVSARGQATAAGSLALAGTATAATTAAATGALALDSSTTAAAPATASGALTFDDSATAQETAGAQGSLALGGTSTAAAVAIATGSLTLGATATASAPEDVTASGTLTLGGSTTAGAQAAATGSITLGGSVDWKTTTTGSLTLGGGATAKATAVALGTVSLAGLAGLAGAAGNAAAAGLLQLLGTASAGRDNPGTGRLTFGGVVYARGLRGAVTTVHADGPPAPTPPVPSTDRVRVTVTAE